ncbi:MAG: NAD(+)/NADH kinase [Anaerolineae bacterium]|nr:NAD(+)/NADH kinase [Anaerolineae bacterium]
MQKLTEIHNVGLLYNPLVPEALPLAQEIVAWLKANKTPAWYCSCEQREATKEPADFLITLGGDGTILRAVRTAAPDGLPILGINMGRVGFLTEAAPDAWQDALKRILAGEGWIEARTMLRVMLLRNMHTVAQEDAANDAVISRGALARTVRLETSVDGAFLTRYVADGLILATATGSTAYAYASGGPILPPWLNNILIVPAAPHLSLERPLVLDASAIVEVKVDTAMPGMLTVDGRMEGELLHGDIVRVERSPLKARFLRLRSRSDFYRTLVPRLIPRAE